MPDSKRIFDIVFSSILLLLLSPIMVITAIFVRLNLGRPILFKQVRAGFEGKPFLLFKFRTMKNAYRKNGALLSDDKRLTSLGNLLRSISVDELPQLYNVLRGDMSLVGPRPLLMEYNSRYTSRQFDRHNVKPGLTGWAQINGRNNISWEERFNLDLWYIDNKSLWLDLKILFLTAKNVILRSGINHSNHDTMPIFTGKENDTE